MSIKDILNELEHKSVEAIMNDDYKTYILGNHPKLSNSDVRGGTYL
jgi:hypothetical protein